MTSRDCNTQNNGLNSLNTSTLRKGATFQSPTSPFYGVSSLRRTQTTLDEVVGAYRRRAESAINDIDQTLAGLASNIEPISTKDECPVPRGLLNAFLVNSLEGTMDSSVKMEEGRRVLRSRSNRQPSDSGIGSSIITTPTKRVATTTKKGVSNTKAACTQGSTSGTAIVRSAAASLTKNHTGLSQKGFARISEHVLRPLLANSSMKNFLHIIHDVPTKIQKKEITCLRDVEKTLLLSAPNKAKSANAYLEFCLTSVALIQTTVNQLSERDQTRSADRPYTNGYFIDLCDQIKHYAGLISAKEKSDTTDGNSAATFSISDEIKLYGGIAINGREAELIRITKDGKAYSLRDGRKVEDYTNDRPEGIPMFKRSLSQAAEDEEEIRRSMARRKKNPTPEELAPKICQHPGCNKSFARPCDLTKHEKTHSRPWKCPEPTCRYHEQGWPTEKEMDRHYNDKHAANPHFYHCSYSPCPYKSKRESNCKQHMEKAHGFRYDRQKNNGKKASASKPNTSGRPTPIVPSLPTPTSEQAFSGSPHNFGFNMVRGNNMTPPAQVDPILFPPLQDQDEFLNQWGNQPADLSLDMDLDFSPVADSGTPSTDFSSESLFNNLSGADMNLGGDDLYAARMQMPPTPSDMAMKDFPTLDGSLFSTNPILDFGDLHNHAQDQLQSTQHHFSPIGQSNTMLFTPSSTKETSHDFTDEGLDCGDDFLLFPPSTKTAPSAFDMNTTAILFPDMPNATNLFQATPTFAGLDVAPSLPSTNLALANSMITEQIEAMDWEREMRFTTQ